MRIGVKRIIEGKSPFEADKHHLHHLILKKAKSHLLSTVFIITVSLLFLIIIQTINN